MKHIKLLIVILTFSCTATTVQMRPPLNISLLPPIIDIDKLSPKEYVKQVDVNKNAPIFEPFPINGGLLTFTEDKIIKKIELQAGFLIDEKTFAQQNIMDQAELKRIRFEIQVIKNLRNKEFSLIKDAEIKYQNRIIELEKSIQPSLWTRTKFYVGILFGVASTISLFFVATMCTSSQN